MKSVPVSPAPRRWLALAAVGCYWGLLFTLTHLPGRPGPEPLRPGIPHLDKLGHAAAFAGLAALVCAVVGVFRPLTVRCLLVIGLGLAVYAAIDEHTQGWVPYRTPDPLDWTADFLGMLAGIASYVLVRRAVRLRSADADEAKVDLPVLRQE